MPKILFEGPDGAFKTTVATLLHEYMDIPYVKFSQSESVDEVVEVTDNLSNDPNFTDCVIDRVKTVDHLVYGTVVDKIVFNKSEYEAIRRCHARLEASTDEFLLVHMTANPGVLWNRLSARGDEYYIKYNDLYYIQAHYDSVYQFYRRHGLLLTEKSITIDTTHFGSAEAFEMLKGWLGI